jgi:predicted RNase H-like HicB family nuclease
MPKYNFTVVIEKDEDGMYVAEVPDLKGCYTQGATVEEVLANIKEVIELCMGTQKNEIKPLELIGVQRVEVCT